MSTSNLTQLKSSHFLDYYWESVKDLGKEGVNPSRCSPAFEACRVGRCVVAHRPDPRVFLPLRRGRVYVLVLRDFFVFLAVIFTEFFIAVFHRVGSFNKVIAKESVAGFDSICIFSLE